MDNEIIKKEKESENFIHRFINEDLKNGVFTSVQAVRAEDDPRPLSDPVRPLKLGYAVVSVLCAATHIC